MAPRLRRQLLAPPPPPVPLVGAPAPRVPKTLLQTQSRRLAAALPTRPRRPTVAERAVEVQGAALELHLPLLLLMAVAVVGAVTAVKSHTPTKHLLLLRSAAVVVEVAAVEVAVAVGAVVVEGAVEAMMVEGAVGATNLIFRKRTNSRSCLLPTK